MLKSTQNQQNVNFLQEYSQTLLDAEFIALKCYIKDELNDIRKTIEKYHKNLIKYLIGNTLRIYGMKLHQRILLLVYLRKIKIIYRACIVN